MKERHHPLVKDELMIRGSLLRETKDHRNKFSSSERGCEKDELNPVKRRSLLITCLNNTLLCSDLRYVCLGFVTPTFFMKIKFFYLKDRNYKENLENFATYDSSYAQHPVKKTMNLWNNLEYDQGF